tara:strand:- start:19998 stop:21233 length:1236 start_codon:yes stop_codon:yes gene_type:complete
VTSHKASPDWHVPTPTALVLLDGEKVGVVGVASHESDSKSNQWSKPVVAGSRNSAVVTKSGSLYTWGWNSHDTLGLDTDEEFIAVPRKIKTKLKTSSLSLGGWHAVAVTSTSEAFAWGGNEYGQAGVLSSARDERHVGVHVSEHVSVPVPVAFGNIGNVNVTQVSCGGMNSFCLVENGSVYQWGALVGSEQEPARMPSRVDGIGNVTQIAAGMFHVLALTGDNKVFSWGKGDYGQLGLGRAGNWDAPMEVTLGVHKPGSDGHKNDKITFVAAGGWHSCALSEMGTCFMWGRGEYGRLGMAEDATDKQTPTVLEFFAEDVNGNENGETDESKKVVDAALGGSHTVLVDGTGAAWTVGRNNHGRLGRVAHGKWTGVPGRVVFPPPRGGEKKWRCQTVVAGGRHTIAVAVAVME